MLIHGWYSTLTRLVYPPCQMYLKKFFLKRAKGLSAPLLSTSEGRWPLSFHASVHLVNCYVLSSYSKGRGKIQIYKTLFFLPKWLPKWLTVVTSINKPFWSSWFFSKESIDLCLRRLVSWFWMVMEATAAMRHWVFALKTRLSWFVYLLIRVIDSSLSIHTGMVHWRNFGQIMSMTYCVKKILFPLADSISFKCWTKSGVLCQKNEILSSMVFNIVGFIPQTTRFVKTIFSWTNLFLTKTVHQQQEAIVQQRRLFSQVQRKPSLQPTKSHTFLGCAPLKTWSAKNVLLLLE